MAGKGNYRFRRGTNPPVRSNSRSTKFSANSTGPVWNLSMSAAKVAHARCTSSADKLPTTTASATLNGLSALRLAARACATATHSMSVTVEARHCALRSQATCTNLRGSRCLLVLVVGCGDRDGGGASTGGGGSGRCSLRCVEAPLQMLHR